MRVMTMATSETGAQALFAQAAAALAAAGDACAGRLIGVCPAASGERFLPAEEFGVALSRDYIDRVAAEAAALNERLKQIFLHVSPSCAKLDWRALAGDRPDLIGEAGRVADLLVLAQPPIDDAAEQELLLQSALFESGRPVLMAPRAATAPSLMRRALVSWNGSVETARALALSLPWLRRCESVRVLAHRTSDKIVGPDAADVAAYLADHGLNVNWRCVEDGADPGPAALREAQEHGCDWIVKGAYTHSRLRQLIFGGATRHILENAEIPVLFAH